MPALHAYRVLRDIHDPKSVEGKPFVAYGLSDAKHIVQRMADQTGRGYYLVSAPSLASRVWAAVKGMIRPRRQANPIPSKWVAAKVRRVRGGVQVMLFPKRRRGFRG